MHDTLSHHRSRLDRSLDRSTDTDSVSPTSDRQCNGEQSLLRADRLAMSLCAAMNRVVIPLSRAATAFVASSSWAVFGFARLDDYSRERLGRSGRWLRDLAALGQLLDQHTCLANAVTGDDGGRPIGRVAALLIGRSAPPHTHDAWIEIARKTSVRQLRQSICDAMPHGIPACSGAASSAGTPEHSRDETFAGASFRRADDKSCTVDDNGPESDPADRSLVRIQVPQAVRTAFDEVLDLFRCVEGTEAPVTAFIEALVAEGIGPDMPTDVDEVPLTRTDGRYLVEDLLARTTNHWAHLETRQADCEEAAGTLAELLTFEALHRNAGNGSAAALDEQMRHLICLEDRLFMRLGQLLTEMGDRGAWSRLRFAGPGHYAQERLRIGRSRAEDRVRVARSLRRFPDLRNAYEQGQLGLEATLQIVRLLRVSTVDRATEQAWVRHAVGTTIKRLRDECRALGRNVLLTRDLTEPHRPAHGEAPLDLTMIALRPLPRPLSDADWQLSLRRAVGTACERVVQLGLLAAGVPHAAVPISAGDNSHSSRPDIPSSIARVPEAVASNALPLSPDVFLRLRLPAGLCTSFLATIESARRRLAQEVDDDPWTESVSGAVARPSWIAARSFSIRARRIPSWVGLMALLEEFADTWDRQHRPTTPSRDLIYIREGWRCAAPGCTSRRNLEDHHVVYRSRGGNDVLSNRICICRFHHQLGEHGDLATCRGRAPLAIIWRLGRAGIGGRYRNERRLVVAA